MASTMERLGINIASIVIGALFFIISISWVEAFKALSEQVFFNTDNVEEYHKTCKKFLSAVFLTALGGFLVIVVYYVYTDNVKASEEKSEDAENTSKCNSEKVSRKESSSDNKNKEKASVEDFAVVAGALAPLALVVDDDNNIEIEDFDVTLAGEEIGE